MVNKQTKPNKLFAQAHNNAKIELISLFGKISLKLWDIYNPWDLAELPKWVRSRIKDENGSIDIDYDGYASKILIIKMEDPWTDSISKRQGKTAFVIYFSYQTSKPLVPAQMHWKIGSIFKVMKKLNEKGYHVFPAIFANSITPGALKILQNPKINIKFFNSLDDLLSWIYSKLLYRLQKLIEVAQFTFKFDKIFIFLKRIIEGIGFSIPLHLLEAWATKPKYPVR
ncbi:hypothetical protein [Sulfolobus monocaudavirus SMV4]|uniref:hypothetical protein n=1 Tax=Sulfolobus monocaudavirus SMV4 TaxID=1732178 RepID=UPI0007066FD7|nr:hypothetical protein AVT99_gp59 [Sulfolobus monocaudavirus SMV4]ALG97083.1 hypothetical protein [Sulfolobus monocaudavirus SMV4]